MSSPATPATSRRNNARSRRLATRLLARLPAAPGTRLRWAARLRGRGRFAEELAIGLRPVLDDPPAPWLAPLLPLSYTKVWGHLGVVGMNYVSVALGGGPVLPLLDPASPFYQAWFGVYAVRSAVRGEGAPFGFDGEAPVPDEIAPLVLADQAYWQEVVTGAPVGESQFVLQSSPRPVTLPFLSERAFLFSGTFSSHSILTLKERQAEKTRQYFPLPDGGYWQHLVEPCHPLELGGVALVWADHRRRTTFCAYGGGARFRDRAGRLHDHIPEVERHLMILLGRLRLRQI